MANKPLNTAILDRAIIFAVHTHTGTERRGKGFPYIVHPMEVDKLNDTNKHEKTIHQFGSRGIGDQSESGLIIKY